MTRRAYRPDRTGSLVLGIILTAIVLLLAWWFLATGNGTDTDGPGESPAVTEPAEPGTPEAPAAGSPSPEATPGEDERTPETTPET